MASNPTGATETQLPPRKGETTRVAILAAAAGKFSEKGYADCSLRDIADLTGLKAASVYYHFASKEELLDAVLATGIDRLTARVLADLGRLPEDADAATRLRTILRAHVGSFIDPAGDADPFLRIYEHLPPVMKRRVRARRHAYADIWMQVFQRGVSEGVFRADVDLTLFVPFLLQGLNGIVQWFNGSRMSVDNICDTIIAVQLDGLRADR